MAVTVDILTHIKSLAVSHSTMLLREAYECGRRAGVEEERKRAGVRPGSAPRGELTATVMGWLAAGNRGTAKQVSKRLHLKLSSVRVTLWQLQKRGLAQRCLTDGKWEALG